MERQARPNGQVGAGESVMLVEGSRTGGGGGATSSGGGGSGSHISIEKYETDLRFDLAV